jgi:hypothetical protein
MNSKIQAPNVNEIIQCISIALFCGIKQGFKSNQPKFHPLWSEESHPFNENFIDLTVSPSVNNICLFLSTTFKLVDLSAECGVMSIAYLDRMLLITGVTLHPSNWKRLFLGAMIVASKVWEDQAVWNSDFLRAFPRLTIQDLSALERGYLTQLNYYLSLKASVYAKYYFELRALSRRDETHFPLLPLDEKGAKKLEMRSIGLERKASKKLVLRSESLNHYELPPKTVSLNV